MLHPNLTLHEVYVLQADGGLRCKVAGFLTEYYTNIREQTKWQEKCVRHLKCMLWCLMMLLITTLVNCQHGFWRCCGNN